MEKLINLSWLNIRCTRLSKDDMKTICKLYFLQTLWLSRCSIKEIPEEIGNLVHLRDIDLNSNKEVEELPDSICSPLELRSHSIQCCSLKKIPREIGNLCHLKSLSLSGNKELKELPESMGHLLGLETLYLDHCSLEEISEEIMNLMKLKHLGLNGNKGFKKLPEKICSFLELQSLNMQDCWNLCSLPEGLARLPRLRSLTGFLGGSGCGRFGLLKNLNNSHDTLCLMVKFSGCSDVEELVKDAREAELRNKIHLQRLKIYFRIMNESNEAEEECSSSSLSLPSSLWVDVIETLEPHDNLQRLYISEYKGLRLPNWISSPLNQVRKISLVKCCEVSSLPPFGKLSCLEELCMLYIEKLKVLGVEWLGIRGGEVIDVESSSLIAFPKLKTLVFGHCGEWCEWEDIAADEEVYAVVSLMPCLSELVINTCSGLKMLPHRLLRKALSLKLLQIPYSTQLIKCYGDKEGSPWRAITRNNPQLQLQTDFL